MTNECLDIIDENDNVLACADRSIAHALGLRHRGVHVFLFTLEKQLLVQHRQNNVKSWPLALDCSLSEHLKTGESYFTAAQRGLEEELGISNVDIWPVVKFRLAYGPCDLMISQLYQGNTQPDQVTINFDEVKDLSHYRLESLMQMIKEEQDSFTPWFKELLRWYCGIESNLEIIPYQ